MRWQLSLYSRGTLHGNHQHRRVKRGSQRDHVLSKRYHSRGRCEHLHSPDFRRHTNAFGIFTRNRLFVISSSPSRIQGNPQLQLSSPRLLSCHRQIDKKKCKLGDNNIFSVTIIQFPCTLAYFITGHKVQGQSLNSVILGTLSPIHQYGTTGWIYVILSRVRTLSGLFLLTKLCTDVTKYKPRLNVMREMSRLREIEKITLIRLLSSSIGENIC